MQSESKIQTITVLQIIALLWFSKASHLHIGYTLTSNNIREYICISKKIIGVLASYLLHCVK